MARASRVTNIPVARPARRAERGQSYGQSGSGQPSYGQSSHGQSGHAWGQAGQAGESRGGQSGAAHHDENYRRWRDQQISALDRDYEEYCRQRQQQFEQDFSSFRQTRQNRHHQRRPDHGQSGAPARFHRDRFQLRRCPGYGCDTPPARAAGPAAAKTPVDRPRRGRAPLRP
jgi:hypothetical protein